MKNYSNEKNVQIIISLLKSHGINKVVASPGTTNVALVASFQSDPYFTMYSVVDERSAAYIACGISAEASEPVVISCTGATASRNYLPGLTEAYYRKLPIISITSTQPINRVGHNVSQVIDRSSMPNDVVKVSYELPIVNNEDDFWECEVKVNMALNELYRNGGGPVHLNLPTTYDQTFSVNKLPRVRHIKRFSYENPNYPKINANRVVVLIGSHKKWSDSEIDAIDNFCETNNAVVFCEHSSNYRGKFWFNSIMISAQKNLIFLDLCPDLIIDIGEINGETYNGKIVRNRVWRVSLDGQIRDRYRQMEYIFELSEKDFFEYYSNNNLGIKNSYFQEIKQRSDELFLKIPDLPFSNIWCAYKISENLPKNSVIHFGILNSLRSWNFFKLPASVLSDSNSGGYGIDGCLSSLIGASFVNPKKIYFGIIGDLSFFYDMNSLGNRHISNNIRILLINNGKGTEFRQFMNAAYKHGESTDDYIAAAGHFGDQSEYLVKNYAENLKFEYMSAKNKSEFENCFKSFISPKQQKHSIIFEVFTTNFDENEALLKLVEIHSDLISDVKSGFRKVIGNKGIDLVKKIIKN